MEVRPISKICFVLLFFSSLFSQVSFSATTIQYSYHDDGQISSIKGPRQNVLDLTTFTYDSKGNKTSETNARGHKTFYAGYNKFGLPTTITSANGELTELSYTPEGWLFSSTTRGRATQYSYNELGYPTKILYPDGSWVSKLYDQARRVIGEDDSTGKRVRYALDPMGNRIKTYILQPQGSEIYSTALTKFDELGRVIAETSATGATNRYEYDLLGNLIETTSARGTKTKYAYDPLGRRVSSEDPAGGVTRFTYNSADKLVQVIDSRGSQTAYEYDYNGNVTKLVSADAGTTINSYDEASNLIKTIDARGVVVEQTFDQLNRRLERRYPASPFLNIRYEYDGGGVSFNIGNLTKVTDNSGTTLLEYAWDNTLLATLFSPSGLNRTFDAIYQKGANKISYESHGEFETIYEHDAGGNIVAIRYQLGSKSGYIATNIQRAHGALRGMLFGNGMPLFNSYDKNLGLREQALAGSVLRNEVDANGNVVYTAGSARYIGASKFKYDELDRLVEEQVNGVTLKYEWDAIGNRIKREVSNAPNELRINNQLATYSPSSNRTSSINGVPSVTDSAGNETQAGGFKFIYDDQGRVAEVRDASGSKISENKYNFLGQRVLSFRFSPAGHLLKTFAYEYDRVGKFVGLANFDSLGNRESQLNWVWLDSKPLAQVASLFNPDGSVKSTQVVYIHADHLNTPRALYGDNKALLWTLSNDAFGVVEPNYVLGFDSQSRSANTPLRFPGQIYDGLAGLHYNYFRDYNPDTGRYLQSDPIGLNGGLNTYGYAYGNPVTISDPLGLCGPFTPVCAWVYANTLAINTGGIMLAEAGAGVSLGVGAGVAGATFGGRVAGPAIYDVYLGVKGGDAVYVGISSQMSVRAAQHGSRFDELVKINSQALTRDQSRVIEQFVINQNPQFENIRNSISPGRSWYDEAVKWGKEYMQCRP